MKMRFTVITAYGKKANLFAPGVKTRQKFAELHGDPFQMDKNHQHGLKYRVKNVIAVPSPDTSIVWILLSFIASLFIFNNEYHYFFISISVAFVVFVWRVIITGLDRKAVEKFNNS